MAALKQVTVRVGESGYRAEISAGDHTLDADERIQAVNFRPAGQPWPASSGNPLHRHHRPSAGVLSQPRF